LSFVVDVVVVVAAVIVVVVVVVDVVVVVFIISFHFLVWCMKVSRESSRAYMKLVWWIGD